MWMNIFNLNRRKTHDATTYVINQSFKKTINLKQRKNNSEKTIIKKFYLRNAREYHISKKN